MVHGASAEDCRALTGNPSTCRACMRSIGAGNGIVDQADCSSTVLYWGVGGKPPGSGLGY